ncbi:MAG: dihydrofolate reductase [Candidatus Peribacteria bacterium]|nr:MAG: dihydrofolate reductase [Candidatus Peribacteria bacterium]
MTQNFSMILAVDDHNGLGRNNDLAWKLKAEMKYFKETTTNTKDLGKLNAVVMGRRTWESIPAKFRPLPNRINCILSRSLNSESTDSQIDDFVLYFQSLDHCLKELQKKDNIEEIFIIGGGQLYNSVLRDPRLKTIYITRVHGDHHCDVFFDGVPDDFTLETESEAQEENGVTFRFQVWKRK